MAYIFHTTPTISFEHRPEPTGTRTAPNGRRTPRPNRLAARVSASSSRLSKQHKTDDTDHGPGLIYSQTSSEPLAILHNLKSPVSTPCPPVSSALALLTYPGSTTNPNTPPPHLQIQNTRETEGRLRSEVAQLRYELRTASTGAEGLSARARYRNSIRTQKARGLRRVGSRCALIAQLKDRAKHMEATRDLVELSLRTELGKANTRLAEFDVGRREEEDLRSQIAHNLQSELQMVSARLAAVEEEEDLRSEIAQHLQTELNKANARLAEFDVGPKEEEDLRSEIAQLKVSATHMEATRDLVEHKLRSELGTANALLAELGVQRSEEARLRSQVAQMEASQHNLRTDLENANTRLAAFDVGRREEEDLRSEIAELKLSATHMEATRDLVEHKLRNELGTANALLAKLDVQRSEEGELRSQIAQMEASQHNLRTDLENANTRLAAFDVGRREEEDLRSEIAELKLSATHMAKLDVQRSEEGKLRSQIAQMEASQHNLRTDLENANTRLAAFDIGRREEEDLRSEIAELNVRATHMEATRDLVEHKLRNELGTANALLAKLDVQRSEEGKLRSQIAQMEASQHNLRTDLDNANTRLAAFEVERMEDDMPTNPTQPTQPKPTMSLGENIAFLKNVPHFQTLRKRNDGRETALREEVDKAITVHNLRTELQKANTRLAAFHVERREEGNLRSEIARLNDRVKDDKRLAEFHQTLSDELGKSRIEVERLGIDLSQAIRAKGAKDESDGILTQEGGTLRAEVRALRRVDRQEDDVPLPYKAIPHVYNCPQLPQSRSTTPFCTGAFICIPRAVWQCFTLVCVLTFSIWLLAWPADAVRTHRGDIVRTFRHHSNLAIPHVHLIGYGCSNGTPGVGYTSPMLVHQDGYTGRVGKNGTNHFGPSEAHRQTEERFGCRNIMRYTLVAATTVTLLTFIMVRVQSS